jgi:hypothetical protein
MKSVSRPFAARLPRRIPLSSGAIARPRHPFVMPSDTDASALARDGQVKAPAGIQTHSTASSFHMIGL